MLGLTGVLAWLLLIATIGTEMAGTLIAVTGC